MNGKAGYRLYRANRTNSKTMKKNGLIDKECDIARQRITRANGRHDKIGIFAIRFMCVQLLNGGVVNRTYTRCGGERKIYWTQEYKSSGCHLSTLHNHKYEFSYKLVALISALRRLTSFVASSCSCGSIVNHAVPPH